MLFHNGMFRIIVLSTNAYIGIPFAFARRYSRLVIDFPLSNVEPYLLPIIKINMSARCSTMRKQFSTVPIEGSIGKE